MIKTEIFLKTRKFSEKPLKIPEKLWMRGEGFGFAGKEGIPQIFFSGGILAIPLLCIGYALGGGAMHTSNSLYRK